MSGSRKPAGAPVVERSVTMVLVGMVVVCGGLAGCGDPPALQVGPVGYQAEELGVLGPSQVRTLTELTAFGLAVSRDRVDELIEDQVRGDLRSIVLQRAAMEMSLDEAGIGDSVLRDAYAANPQHELVVRHLVVLSERWRPPEHRDSARARAREALERIEAGLPFEAAVAEYSDEARAADRGGLLRPGREGTWTPDFWQAASALEVGEVSDVVETEFGFHVLRLEERRPVPFEDARQDVLHRFVDLEQSLSSAAERVAAVQAEMQVDTAAVLGWREEPSPELELITWPESLDVPAFTGADLSRHVGSFRPETEMVIQEMDSLELVGYVERATRTHIMLARARAQGIEPSESQRVAIHRRWEDQVARWADALGFERGMSRAAVKAQAFRALSSPQQSAAQARPAIRRLSASLRDMYPVVRRETQDG